MPRKKYKPANKNQKAAQIRNFGIFRIRGAHASLLGIDTSLYSPQQILLLKDAQLALSQLVESFDKTKDSSNG